VAIGEEPGQDFVIEMLDLDPISDGLNVAHGLRREPLYAITTDDQLGDRGDSAPLITSGGEHVTSGWPAQRGV
jgi:hypothetical protein